MVAAGSIARATGTFFRHGVWALALGLGLGLGLRGDGLSLTLSLAIALALVASSLLAVVTGTITLGGPPAAPPTGLLLAVGGTVASLGPSGDEPAFAVLDQAAPAAMRTPADAQESLTRREKVGIVEGAHGRECTPRVKSRGEGAIFPPRRIRCRRSGSGKRRSVSISLPSEGLPSP